MTDFTMTTTIQAPYESTVERVRELLAVEGFGVLTEIDLSATLKDKLDVDLPRQVILGACRPQLAHAALQADPRIATMLPCNVVVAAEGESTRVEIFDPGAMVAFAPHADLSAVVDDARTRLSGVLTALTESQE